MTGSESVVSYRYFSKGIKNQRVKALFENKHILTKNHRFSLYLFNIFVQIGITGKFYVLFRCCRVDDIICNCKKVVTHIVGFYCKFSIDNYLNDIGDNMQVWNHSIYIPIQDRHYRGTTSLTKKFSMFCALSQNYQHLFWKLIYASYSILSKELKNSFKIYVGLAVCELSIKTMFWLFWSIT